jgi:hypothetical protein
VSTSGSKIDGKNMTAMDIYVTRVCNTTNVGVGNASRLQYLLKAKGEGKQAVQVPLMHAETSGAPCRNASNTEVSVLRANPLDVWEELGARQEIEARTGDLVEGVAEITWTVTQACFASKPARRALATDGIPQ